jgi:antitoxin CptB
VDSRRKRIIFRSQHRGMVETDWFLGRFAERFISDMTDVQLDRFEALLDVGDNDVFSWVSGREPVPPDYQNDVMDLLIDFNHRR